MGKCIEIEQSDDGTFAVSECEPKTEMAMGEENGESTGQQYRSLDEALQAAAALLTADGRTEAEAQAAGYAKGAPSARPTPQAVFGEG